MKEKTNFLYMSLIRRISQYYQQDKYYPKVLFFCLALLISTIPSLAEEKLKWYRGQLHTHTYWSDGRGFPEQAIVAYKNRGYNFLSLTEHNTFADRNNTWCEVRDKEGGWPPKIINSIFEAYLDEFGEEWVETQEKGSRKLVRLKTYAELKKKFEEKDKFILFPGLEITQNLKKTNNKIAVHTNLINLPLVLPCVKNAGLNKNIKGKETVNDLISLNSLEAKQAATKLGKPYMLIVNHPFFVYCDILPQNLIESPEIRFFELCDGGSKYAPPPEAKNYDAEKFWDVVNAFRITNGHPLLYGIGSDDAHFYDAKRRKRECGVNDAWVMVRAKSLNPEDLIESMKKGDFYASNGVLLDEMSFSVKDKILRVKVKTEKGVKYKIHFISTKKGFDQNMTEVHTPSKGKRSPRSIPIYSDDIGRKVKSVNGTEASYKMQNDDLYIRASIESDIPAQITPYFHPKVKMAWTQPYTVK